MQKPLTMALAAAGLLALSQVSFANAFAPSPGNQMRLESSGNVPVKYGGGGGGGFGHGGGGGLSHGSPHGGVGMGPIGGTPSFSMGHGPMVHGPGAQGFAMRHGPITHGPAMGYGRVYGRHFHHGHFRGGPFFGFGLDYGYPDWYGGGSCYWNCRTTGHAPGYCRAYAWEYCY